MLNTCTISRRQFRADLFMQEERPFVRHKLIVKVVMSSHLRQKALYLRGHVVLDEPELHTIPALKSHCSLKCRLDSFGATEFS